MSTHQRLLTETPPFRVTDFRCSVEDGRQRERGCGLGHDIVLVRRGAFTVRRGSRETLVFAGRALLVWADQEFSVQHPFGDDEGVTITLREPALESIEDRPLRGWFARGEMDVGSSLLLGQTRLLWHAADPLAASTVAAELLSSLLGPRLTAPTGSARDAAADAAAILRARFAESLTLPQISTAIGVSCFHLARLFRSRYGESIHRYRNTLRMIAAVKRLEQGERDLAALALDLGFSDHSHFAAAFRRHFGVPPSNLRRRTAGPDRAGFS